MLGSLSTSRHHIILAAMCIAALTPTSRSKSPHDEEKSWIASPTASTLAGRPWADRAARKKQMATTPQVGGVPTIDATKNRRPAALESDLVAVALMQPRQHRTHDLLKGAFEQLGSRRRHACEWGKKSHNR